jgi:hypothetical protein
MERSYAELPNGVVGAANGISYAYRQTGGHDRAVPVVLLQHFRGNLDSWDPALLSVKPVMVRCSALLPLASSAQAVAQADPSPTDEPREP